MNEMFVKDFENWNKIKKKLDNKDPNKIPPFYEREIWWCLIGQNVGFEIYGKGKLYLRPVLIFKKHNIHTFYGFPLGSTTQKSIYKFPIITNDRKGSILFSQGRALSSNRLLNRIVKISESKFAKISKAYIELYN